jgi:glycosyltransferase involved in cell wall biosynthesis
MSTLCVIILTYNEEVHIDRAIMSVRGIAQEMVVVDSNSTDATVDVATRHGARVIQRPFINQAEQFQWALDNVAIKSEWIMRLDADEYIDSELGKNIIDAVNTLPLDVSGINLNRRHVFMGRWIKHGGRYPISLLRIWRRGFVRVEQQWMDEHIVLISGRAITVPGVFVDENLKPISDFIAKHNVYASREALQIHLNRLRVTDYARGRLTDLSSGQAQFRRFMKLYVFSKIPFPVAAIGYFFLRYVVQLGFLDGTEGLIYHFNQALWYRILVGAKVREMERAIRNVPDAGERKSILHRMAGLPANAV